MAEQVVRWIDENDVIHETYDGGFRYTRCGRATGHLPRDLRDDDVYVTCMQCIANANNPKLTRQASKVMLFAEHFGMKRPLVVTQLEKLNREASGGE